MKDFQNMVTGILLYLNSITLNVIQSESED